MQNTNTAREAPLRSFRITVPEPAQSGVAALLEAEGFRFEPEPFSACCRRLTAEPRPLGSSLAAFFGLIYIQDRSSMLPPLALAPEKGAAVLDMCASPGSKTGFLAQLVGPGGFVLANEVSHSRLFTLRQNLRVCNFLQAGTCSYEGQHIPLAPGSLRYIQLDPPCSGWGTAVKNPKVMELWHDDKVKPLIGLQRLLLRRAAELLAPGGVVVYSTCTTNSGENERQVEYAEACLGLTREPLDPFPGFYWDDREGSEGTLRVDGERSRSQGFYVARLRKTGEPEPEKSGAGEDRESRKQGRRGKERPGARHAASPGQDVDLGALSSATVDPGLLPDGRCAAFSGTLRFLPAQAEPLLPEGFVWQGAPLGRFGAGGFVPDSRLRALMPEEGPRVVLESVDEVRALLGGRSLTCDLKVTEAALWYRDLPLGRVSLRKGRVIATFQ